MIVCLYSVETEAVNRRRVKLRTRFNHRMKRWTLKQASKQEEKGKSHLMPIILAHVNGKSNYFYYIFLFGERFFLDLYSLGKVRAIKVCLWLLLLSVMFLFYFLPQMKFSTVRHSSFDKKKAWSDEWLN